MIDSFEAVVSRSQITPDDLYDELDNDMSEFWENVNKQIEYKNIPKDI